MTDERKDEIWQGLPIDLKEQLQKDWRDALGKYKQNKYDLSAAGQIVFLGKCFGVDNLYRAIENPKENNNINKASDKTMNLVQENLHNIVKNSVYYQQYRLDLAKEIAVAMINNDWSLTKNISAIALDVVDMTNEIVKRLKETEE